MKHKMLWKKRIVLGIVTLFCVAFLVMLNSLPVQAEQETIPVGFFAFDGYHEQDSNGDRSGYGYEILQKIAGYTNWRYEYIGYEKDWNEMFQLLEDGEIRLLTSVQKTPEREEKYDFSERSIGSSSCILTAKAGDTDYLAGDYEHWNGIRIGLLDGNSRNEDLAQFAELHDFTYETILFSNQLQMEDALQSGDTVDMIMTSDLRYIQDEWVLASFAPSPFYICVKKGDSELLNELNYALEQYESLHPSFRSELMNQYYTPHSIEEIAYTAEERAYIESMENEVILAILNPDRIPFSYMNEGQLTGILYDISQKIAERSGLQILFVLSDNRTKYWDMVENHEVDLWFDAGYDQNLAENMGYRLTDSYLDISISKVFRKDAETPGTLALLSDSAITREYSSYFTKLYQEVVYYDTLEELIAAVKSGKADATYLYSRTAEMMAYDDQTNQLVKEELYGFSNSFTVAVNEDCNPLLYAVLNKAVNSISVDEIKAIDRKYASHDSSTYSLIGFVYNRPIMAIVFVILVFLIVAIVFWLTNVMRGKKQEQHKLQEEERRNKLLEDALHAAESADLAKTQFLSRVSHELRTPLNAIIGFMELAKGENQEKMELYRRNSEVAAKQLLAVINDVLDMSSIESGKMQIAKAPFDFKQMIMSITNIYVPQCQQKGIQFETKILTPLQEWLIGDQHRVNQILMNLIGNAYKFTEKGSICLAISEREAGNNEVFIRFRVTDTGCGMSDEMQNRLFKPFEQENAVTARKYGGNGLGLSIVKNLVNMMNGAIRVESHVNEGTTFMVDLPFGKSGLQQEVPTIMNINEMHLLTVDDEKDEREYVSVVMERIGVRHTCVKDGTEALMELERAEREHDAYNICLVDWKMPVMDGLEITKSIRQKYGKDVVVIVLSAYEHNLADRVALEAGANMFITKPLFQSTILDLFMNLTGGRVRENKVEVDIQKFQGKRLLLAEDNAMNRMVALGIIKRLGIECDGVDDGQKAVDRFLKEPPDYYDAILMDIQMPNVDGFEATKKIRESSHPRAKTIQIIALTANAFHEDIARSLSCGMNAHVTKPIELDALMKALTIAF